MRVAGTATTTTTAIAGKSAGASRSSGNALARGYDDGMDRERDPLLESLKALVCVADETLGSVNSRDYAKTRQLMARRTAVAEIGKDYRRELGRSGKPPSHTYRCIEDLDRDVKACLTEMDSVQSAANAEVVLGLKRARALAAEFATAAELEVSASR
jgi:hypothetical protein